MWPVMNFYRPLPGFGVIQPPGSHDREAGAGIVLLIRRPLPPVR